MMNNHGLKPGDKVIVLTITASNGVFRNLFRYDTAASWEEYDGKGNKKPNVIRTIEAWDGKEFVNFSNGD